MHLVAGNLYNLPFKNEVIDAAMMVRVLHHIEKPEQVIDEISRILHNNSTFILEFANKFHIKAVIRAFLKLDMKFLVSREPYKIPTSSHAEGTPKDDPGIYYNFSFPYTKTLLVSRQIFPRKTLSLSFFRIPTLKKIVDVHTLSTIERIFQKIFGLSKITPSVIIIGNKITKEDMPSENIKKLEDVVCCPKCRGDLHFEGSNIACTKCKLHFSKVGSILDLRYPVQK